MKNQLTLITIVLTLCSMLLGCSHSGGGSSGSLKEGGIYSFKNDNGTYSVLKILKLESAGLHIRVYSNQFDSAPTHVDESTLYMAGVDHKPNETLGLADAPITQAAFAANWKPTFVQQSTVKPDELDGYNAWKNAGGKYF